MKPIDQLNLWVDNISAHNKETDECCPDFSCCRHDISTPRYIKLAFQKSYIEGNENLNMQMLMLFLGQLLGNDFNIEERFKEMSTRNIYEDIQN